MLFLLLGNYSFGQIELQCVIYCHFSLSFIQSFIHSFNHTSIQALTTFYLYFCAIFSSFFVVFLHLSTLWCFSFCFLAKFSGSVGFCGSFLTLFSFLRIFFYFQLKGFCSDFQSEESQTLLPISPPVNIPFVPFLARLVGFHSHFAFGPSPAQTPSD